MFKLKELIVTYIGLFLMVIGCLNQDHFGLQNIQGEIQGLFIIGMCLVIAGLFEVGSVPKEKQ